MKILRIALVLVLSFLLLPWHSQVAAQQSTGDAVSTEVINHEKLAWEATKKKDKTALAKLLADDFTEITDDGVFDKGQMVANLDNIQLLTYSPRNFKARTIAPDVVLLIFQVTVTGKYKGQDFHSENNAASLWAKRSGTWQNVHFQETLAPKQESVQHLHALNSVD